MDARSGQMQVDQDKSVRVPFSCDDHDAWISRFSLYSGVCLKIVYTPNLVVNHV